MSPATLLRDAADWEACKRQAAGRRGLVLFKASPT